MAMEDVEIVEHPFHGEDGRFKSGNIGGPGRPKGAKPKLAAMFWNDLYAVWKAKGMGILERMSDEDPVNFAKIAAMLVGKCEEARDDRDEHDAAVAKFIEERRQKALVQIAKMREPD